MKANRKFQNEDDAVSPVIAVILMVAITVVLAATVYVWVSGFGSQGSQSKNLSLSQGTLAGAGGASGDVKFTVVSVTPNFSCSVFKATSTGTGGPWTTLGTTAAGAYRYTVNGGTSCTSLAAGDIIDLNWGTGTVGPSAGNQINFIDTSASTVISSITLHS